MSASFPSELRYAKDHEWVKTSGTRVKVGITSFAVEQLGDVTLVTLDVKKGDVLTAGKTFGTVESVKTLSDLYVPISGKVLEVNSTLDSKPELVNEDCYGEGWMIEMEMASEDELKSLLDDKAYGAFVHSLS